ncbi:MAG TPA: metalloregulator ArsR/SmtB family transcription factor, partial [Nitrososphaera sp.]|nr:metalloregulator ArsR/SmtB family transcription factor [Nitrososphaera sp.]
LQEGEITVGALAKKLRMRQAHVSQHLAVLRQRNVVKARRNGSNIYYGISNPKIVKACNLIREVLLEQLQKDQSLVAEIRND